MEPETIFQAVKDGFKWGIGIGSLLAVVFFAIGAVQFFALMGGPDSKKDAKDRMISSILGMLLLLVSFLIIDTINPKIEELKVEGLGGTPGIYYSNGKEKDDRSAPMSERDTAYIKNLKYTKIKYKCIDDASGVPLLIWFFPKTDFKDSDATYSGTKLEMVPCGGEREISGASFKISFRYPGVYFFLGQNCTGFMSEAITSDLAPLPDIYAKKIKSILIINDTYFAKGSPNKASYYGVILKDSKSLSNTSLCTEPLLSYEAKGDCHNVDIQAQSARIFNYTTTQVKKGESLGVILFSKPWGWAGGTFSGKFEPKSTASNVPGGASILPKNAIFGYRDCDLWTNNCDLERYRTTMCPTFAECPGSMKIEGGRFMVLSTDSKYGEKTMPDKSVSTCQIFNTNINSAKEQEFFATGKTLGSIRVIFQK